uniref:(northern house mosquito) hypothetical protein n=1 Tax=Culex pipiens TaxID=7175 RepID=A0A8D8FIZ0_CULPI
MTDFVLFVKPKLAMMCLPSLSPPSWLPSFRSTLAAPLLSSVMKRVVKYRWQIDRLKILQALLGNFCAKIPFFFLFVRLVYYRALHFTSSSFCILLCLLVKYISFCVGFVLYFSYGNN